MTPALAVVMAVVTLCVGISSLAAIAVALGKVLQRLEELARVVAKIDGWIEDLKKGAHDQRGAHQLTVAQLEQLRQQVVEQGKNITVVNDLAHELAKDLARHEAELNALRSLTPAHGVPAGRPR